VGNSPVVIRESIIGVDLDNYIVISNSVIISSLVEVNQSSILMGDADCWIDIDGSSIVIDGFVIVPHSFIGEGSVVVSKRIVRVDIYS